MDVKCVLADFSSGYDEFSGRNLYGSGPSAAEQTDECEFSCIVYGCATLSLSR